MTKVQMRQLLILQYGGQKMGEKKEDTTKAKTARAIVFTAEEKLEEYEITAKQKIQMGTESVTVSCEAGVWIVDAADFKEEIWINNSLYSGSNSVFEVQDRDILQFRNEVITTLVLESTRASDLQWKTLPLSDDFPVIRIRHVSDELTEADTDSQDEGVDAHEAEIRLTGNAWNLSDVHTDRGIFVNGERVEESCELKPMDVIRAGNTLFFFGSHQLFYSHTIFHGNNLSIHIEERSVKSFFRKHILLQDINLTIEPGNMVLILGGSGAGKTTFVNAVTGYEKAKAQILQDGIDVYENYGKLKHSIGFVPQQDLLREDDTVEKTVQNSAELRLSKRYTEKERNERVAQVLEMFGLGGLKDELVRKLSGGQRKRLSICVEFISDPKLFFLDEPDSGLDGVMAKDLMEHLRKIADQDKIVLVITHTPDRVIDLFDKVIVLAKGTQDHIGHLAFFGGIQEAREFFGKETMEEIVLAVNGIHEGGEGRADEFINRFKAINPEEKANV